MNYEQKNYGTIGKAKNSQSYIEELSPSACFLYNKVLFVLTQDYKKDGSRLAVSLNDGCSRWLSPSVIVQPIDIYITNEDGHLVLVEGIQNENLEKD